MGCNFLSIGLKGVKYNSTLIVLLLASLIFTINTHAQTAEDIVNQVRAKIATVNDYEANGKMKTNVAFIKAPLAKVKVYFKKPNKLRVKNESGISFIPKGSVNINLGNIFATSGNYDIIGKWHRSSYHQAATSG